LSQQKSIQYACKKDKQIEIAIVAFADAVAQPGTVMVKPFDAGVTVSTVHSSGGPVVKAPSAELYLRIVALDWK
jgi:hypothetical protein